MQEQLVKPRFSALLEPLATAVPAAGITELAQAFDGLSLSEWAAVGLGAADCTAAIRYEDLSIAAAHMVGEVWKTVGVEVRTQAFEFAEAASDTAEVKAIWCGPRRIRNIGYATLGAVAERLAALRPPAQRGLACGSTFFHDIFAAGAAPGGKASFVVPNGGAR